MEIDIVSDTGIWRVTLGGAYERSYSPTEVKRVALEASQFVDDLFWFAVTQMGEGLDEVNPNEYRSQQLQKATKALIDALDNISKESVSIPARF